MWLAVGIALLGAARAAAVPLLHLEIEAGGGDGIVVVGEVVTVSVLASGIPAGSDGLGLFGFGFSLLYDAAGFEAADPIAGPLWNGTGFEQSRNEPGDVGLMANRFFEPDGPFGDDILLGTIELTARAVGLFSLDLTYFTGVGDNLLFDGTVLDSDPEAFFGSGSIRVVQPLPQVPTSSPRALMLIVSLLLSTSWLALHGRRDRLPCRRSQAASAKDSGRKGPPCSHPIAGDSEPRKRS